MPSKNLSMVGNVNYTNKQYKAEFDQNHEWYIQEQQNFKPKSGKKSTFQWGFERWECQFSKHFNFLVYLWLEDVTLSSSNNSVGKKAKNV